MDAFSGIRIDDMDSIRQSTLDAQRIYREHYQKDTAKDVYI